MTQQTGTNSVVSSMLRAAARGETLDVADGLDASVMQWLSLSGLSPLLCHLLRDTGTAEESIPAPLRGAELASRVQTAQLYEGLNFALCSLMEAGIKPAVIKGITFAHRYYPQPHLRVMKDVDFLVDPAERPPAEQALLDVGFIRGPGMTFERYLDHHHAAPLLHPEKGIWVEIHSGLLPPGARAIQDKPICFESLAELSEDADFLATPALCLKPEVEFMLLATAWCRDLGHDIGEAGLQRRLFDAIYLLKSVDDFDWEQIIAWSHGTLTGKCARVLMSYLNRHGAVSGAAAEATTRLHDDNRYAGPRSAALVHRLLDRYLVADHPRPRRISFYTIAIILDGLLGPSPQWRSLATLPVNLAFPRQNPERFRPGFHWHRLKSVLSRLK